MVVFITQALSSRDSCIPAYLPPRHTRRSTASPLVSPQPEHQCLLSLCIRFRQPPFRLSTALLLGSTLTSSSSRQKNQPDLLCWPSRIDHCVNPRREALSLAEVTPKRGQEWWQPKLTISWKRVKDHVIIGATIATSAKVSRRILHPPEMPPSSRVQLLLRQRRRRRHRMMMVAILLMRRRSLHR